MFTRLPCMDNKSNVTKLETIPSHNGYVRIPSHNIVGYGYHGNIKVMLFGF